VEFSTLNHPTNILPQIIIYCNTLFPTRYNKIEIFILVIMLIFDTIPKASETNVLKNFTFLPQLRQVFQHRINRSQNMK